MLPSRRKSNKWMQSDSLNIGRLRMIEYSVARKKMVEEQIALRGIRDPQVLEAFLKVPREAFVPKELQDYAYDDCPLPIAENQTISQPYIVALMAETANLTKEGRCLEIGTGSGYSAAILAELANQVYTIERIPVHSDHAQQILNKLKYSNITTKTGDGSQGWPEKAPFDAIIVTAAASIIPDQLFEQLKIGGRLVIPVGKWIQELKCFHKTGERTYEEINLGSVRFVPLITSFEF